MFKIVEYVYCSFRDWMIDWWCVVVFGYELCCCCLDGCFCWFVFVEELGVWDVFCMMSYEFE